MRGVNCEDSGGLGSAGRGGGQLSGSALLCLESQTRSASLKTEPWSSFKPAQLKSLLCNGTLKPFSVKFSIPGRKKFTNTTPLFFSPDPLYRLVYIHRPENLP